MASRLAHGIHGLARSRAAKAVEDYRSPRRSCEFSAGSESLKLMAVGLSSPQDKASTRRSSDRNLDRLAVNRDREPVRQLV